MSEHEFDVLDELYFVISYNELKNTVDIDDDELVPTLKSLHQRGWVKCLSSVDEELPPSRADIDHFYYKYYYLATKEGLMAHNMGEA